MDAEIKTKWIKALRSGEYKQGEKYLNQDNKFCCLGILCDIFAKEKDNDAKWYSDEEWDQGGTPPEAMYGSRYYLPPEVCEWADIKTDPQVKRSLGHFNLLTDLNDGTSGCTRKTFNEIADLIASDDEI